MVVRLYAIFWSFHQGSDFSAAVVYCSFCVSISWKTQVLVQVDAVLYFISIPHTLASCFPHIR